MIKEILDKRLKEVKSSLLLNETIYNATKDLTIEDNHQAWIKLMQWQQSLKEDVARLRDSVALSEWESEHLYKDV